jgi:hypothetical protein
MSILALRQPEWQGRLTIVDLRALSPLKWQHINPYGTLTLNMHERLSLELPRGSVLPFDEAAAVAFQQIRRARLRIGAMDLKLAAIVVFRNATLSPEISQTFVRFPACKLRTGPWDSRRMSSTGHLDLLIAAFRRSQQ